MQNINNLQEKILKNIMVGFEENHLKNSDLLQIIEVCGNYLNLCTRSQYQKRTGKSYNCAKHFRTNIELFGVKFVLDND